MSQNDELRWGKSTVETSCPLDCPDGCSLNVSVEKGKVTKIDGSHRHALTNGYICAKVRGFADRVYGDARLQVPVGSQRPEGSGIVQARVVGRSARPHRRAYRGGARAIGR